MESKLSTAKMSKTTTFSRVFHPKTIDNFLGKLKLNFWTKNEDFEQCVNIMGERVENYPSITGYLSKISLAIRILTSDGHAFVRLREIAKVMHQRPKKGIAFVFMARQ